MQELEKQIAGRLAQALRTEATSCAAFDLSPVLEQSQSTRAKREILRICSYFGWWHELYRALDAAEVVSLEGLTEAQVTALRDRMRKLEECALEGYDCPDAPPAR